MRRFVSFFAAVVLGAALHASARADFVSPTQWVRGSNSRSTYQGWDIFSSPTGPNAPNSPGVPTGAVVDASPFNSNGTGNVTDASGASFITSGGNIYSPTNVVDIDVVVPNYGAAAATFTTVILQTRTLGSPIDLDSVRIIKNAVTYQPIDEALLFTMELGGFGGFLEDRWFQFQLPGNASSYTIEYISSESSMSMDRIAVDTIWTNAAGAVTEPNPLAAPEPATAVLLCVGAAMVMGGKCWRSRRGRRKS